MIYYSDEIAQISQVAGLIHLNKLPMDRVPTVDQLLEICTFASTVQGMPLFLGKDEFGNEVFRINFGKASGLGLQTVYYLLTAFFNPVDSNLTDSNPLDWKFFKVCSMPKYLTKISAFILHTLRMDQPGKILVVYGIQKIYREIAGLVKTTKELSGSFG